MDQGNMTLPPTTGANSSQTPAAVCASHLAAAVLLFPTFLVGVVGNGLYLWVLRLKMRMTVTMLWFLHLISCYLLFTLLIPFFAVYVLLGFHWVFGTVMCKFLDTCISLGMFTSVFLLTLISLDRYTITHHPIWCRHHHNVLRAQRLVAGVWLASFSLSTPYLAFRETWMLDGGRIICINNYALSRDWNRAEPQELGRRVHLAIFMVRFLLGFFLPFCTIVGCCGLVGLKMKEKKLAWTGKPFKVMVAAVFSFFLSWLPYHLYQSLKLYRKEVPESAIGAFLVIYTFTTCFTPILYLFVGEKFWQVFRTSLLTLVKAAFVDDLSSSAPKYSRRHGSEFETTKTGDGLKMARFRES
ncbi:probable G-protein coupled receptor 33 [Dermochelys coriacea]|uniref:probable G-protein coupled receptor 33 n=1 Tax=Dermochelys coriacea TaxID=27794 RepID=UPI0018E73295|nr:probable G-protein coupled receptor 33 [Dermochelys coriacea]XP_043357852.1 probable G-protein coupled receptor 33 [Dermochelys coriacea]XP_043357853.1 probable G-protein coupled receptor 33 [Dermochelys coriacea]